ncbi:SRPBCC domain-containing protein [Parvularcula sp. LCG005]|uniref:SRPBCC domain-containing protein n=1 Tax=Parvularcula sp. LCG005 TaxID=3078805 RepID=UPI002941C462|nr:SRPBCC domain-containing protein [Parvularcula sp. LCG005]WOI52636.1 SRPBCC domain-containing protein [Parvularcula sp. LCG005]
MANDERMLQFRRVLDATPAQVWRAWSEPRLVERWWAPAPVLTRITNFDFRPGGAFDSAMTLADETVIHGQGCFLEVVPETRIAFTDMMTAGWQPQAEGFFTAIFDLSPEGGGTAYHVRALHKTAQAAREHAEMGFMEGWTNVAAQLDRLAQRL